MTFSEFLFPNDLHVFWSLMIVTYPFITGLVAGAFIASSFYYLFGMKELEPISRFSLLLSFAFMTCATLPLLLHLGHPERAFNVMIIPNFKSAIAAFGFIYNFYSIILIFMLWLVYRIEIIESYKKSTGIKRAIWGILTLGVKEVTNESIEADKKVIRILSIIGIPAACILTGYVGFLFGSVKSNPWWSTPLMPQIFVISAIISGLASVILIYLFLGWRGVMDREYKCLQRLAVILWYFIVLAIVFEGLEILFFYYEKGDEWLVVSTLLSGKLFFSFVILQWGLGLLIPFVSLTLILFVKRYEHLFATLAAIASIFALLEVWIMRWNIVIGGQLFSKSFIGFRSYHPHWFEKEGILTTIIITLLPLLILYVLSRFVTLWESEKEKF